MSRITPVQSLFEIRSATAESAMAWLHAVADALDRTGLYFNKQPILGSAMAVDAFVYTKQRMYDGWDPGRSDERKDREVSLIDEQVAHLYEQPTDWDQRVKRRWRQAIQPARIRLGLWGSPGSGKTFLTRHAAVTLARESARQIEERTAHLYQVPVPFWIAAKALAVASGADLKELVVNACLLALKQIRMDLPKPPMDWLQRAVESPHAFIVVDAVDELADEEAAFKLASPRLKDVKGRLIATCRTLHWEQRANWLGWTNVTGVELAPFERKEQREFSRNFPPGVGAPGLEPLLLSNFPLQQACSSPLLLAFVCLLLAEGKNLSGANRVAVYIEIVRKLLSGEWGNVTPPWKGKKGFQQSVLHFLEEAALSIFQAAPSSNRFTLAEFEKTVDAPVRHAELLDELVRCGVLVEAGEDDLGESCWSFLHRTFLEFFAGRGLARKPRGEWLEEAKKHLWYEPEWMEVLTFLAAHVEDAAPLIEALEQEEEDIFYSLRYLKVRLATAARQVAPERLDLIAGELNDLLDQAHYSDAHELWPYYLATVQLARDSQLGERLATALRGLLRDPYRRSIAAEALAELGDAPAIETLLRLMRDDYHSRGYLAMQLGELGDARAVEPLIVLLQDRNRDVRRTAAEALGRLGDARAVEPLLGLLQDTEGYLRGPAAQALGQLGDSRAFEPLLGLLRDKDREVRWRSAEALGWLGDALAIEPLLGLLRDEHSKWSAARALGQLGNTRAVEPLLTLLRDVDRDIRALAASALGQLGNVGTVEPLLDLLRDEDGYVRAYAAEALGRLGDVRAAEPLLVLLRDENSLSRALAASALGQLGHTRAVEPLIGLLRDEQVRGRAAEALGWLGDACAIEPLLGLLRDQNNLVRWRAMSALRRLAVIHRTTAPLLKLRRPRE